jgi:hypothetical protein
LGTDSHLTPEPLNRQRWTRVMQNTAPTSFLTNRAPRPLQPLEAFLRDYAEQAGGVWDEIEPLVYDLLIDDEPLRVTFDPEALPEHPSAQLASLGSPLMDRLLEAARHQAEFTILYASGPNTHPYDLPGRLRRAYAVPVGAELLPTSVRLCFFPQATYGFVGTFISDRKEQATLDVSIDLHSGREVRHLRRAISPDQLSGQPVEPLPEASHLSVPAAFALACQQVARSISPLANQRRRELEEHTSRQIERLQRYYARMREELEQQPRRGASSEADAQARKTARVQAIQREGELRSTELRQKSILHVNLALVSVQVIHLPKLLVKFDLVRPRDRRVSTQAVFDPWTDAFEPIQLGKDRPPTFDLATLTP